MTRISDEDDTIEVHALSTSLDPYGQLVKMLMPRAYGIGIYDRAGTPLWLSDGCEGPDLPELIEESLEAARAALDGEDRDGFARSWNGQTAYVFVLRDASTVLGILAVSCLDSNGSARPFSLVRGLLRPALQVLGRELAAQNALHSSAEVEPTLADSDVEQLLDPGGGQDDADGGELEHLVGNCIRHLGCSLAALFVPGRSISISRPVTAALSAPEREVLEKTSRHLLAWTQIQRRTLMLNKPPPAGPLGALPYRMLACPIRDRAQHVIGVLVLFRAASAREFELRECRIVEMMARHVAYVVQSAYDPATGLLTRPAFEQRALGALATIGTGAHACIAYADIDQLQAINDGHGMHVGDEAIRRIAHALHEHLAAGISAAHISGDRFAFFFIEQDSDAPERFLHGLSAAIAAIRYEHAGEVIGLSASFGLATVDGARPSLSHALANAESACRSAKQHGRGSVEIFRESPREPKRCLAAADQAILGALREAIAGDRFCMEAQPVIELGAAGPPRRFELLLRMIDASGASVAPAKFLGAAERHRLAGSIDRWVVQYALEILSSAASALESLGAQFAVNISGQSLAEEDFPDFLERKLEEYALPPALLSFEVAETAAVANIVRAETLIRRLNALGHGLALDDFGRGLSSVDYLDSLPVSQLKIDGALVRELAGNRRSQPAVAAIVQLAGEAGLETVAKSVETDDMLAAVTRLGVHHGQGFAIGRPRPLELILQELLRAAPSHSPVGGARLLRARG